MSLNIEGARSVLQRAAFVSRMIFQVGCYIRSSENLFGKSFIYLMFFLLSVFGL